MLGPKSARCGSASVVVFVLYWKIHEMTEAEALDFVTRFSAAWNTREGSAFLALWHEEGLLHHPFADRVIKGREIGKLNDMQKANAPKLTWKLVSWTWRNNIVVVEWESSNVYGEHKVIWRGVDKFTLQEGRIIEEVVYSDTAPLRELREGRKFEPLIQMPN